MLRYIYVMTNMHDINIDINVWKNTICTSIFFLNIKSGLSVFRTIQRDPT